MKQNIAIYPGTFDPITEGHVDMVARAVTLFDQLIVAIAININKNPLFDLDERVFLAKQALSQYSNVRVMGFTGLLLDFARLHGANVMLRGLRTVTDFDYEFQLASMNRHLDANIQSVFLMPSEKHMTVSSSLVREIASMGGNVTSFVPAIVAQALQKKFEKK